MDHDRPRLLLRCDTNEHATMSTVMESPYARELVFIIAGWTLATAIAVLLLLFVGPAVF